MSDSKKVLITGIHGFTGGYLVQELEKSGHQVFGLGMHPYPNPDYLQADLRDISSLSAAVKMVSPHWVVHLAGISFVAHKDPNDFYNINLMGTRNLLTALAQNNPVPEKIILAGSANIYGSTSGVISEESLPAPLNDYSVSKLAMEYMARLWHDRLPIIITRPFNYTGKGQSTDFVIPKIVLHFKQKYPSIEMGNLDVSRDFSDVRFVSKVYHKLLEKAPPGETINICSGISTSLRQILDMCRNITGQNLEVSINPVFIRSSEVKTLCGDPTKLKALLGTWDPLPIENTLAWMLEEEEENKS